LRGALILFSSFEMYTKQKQKRVMWEMFETDFNLQFYAFLRSVLLTQILTVPESFGKESPSCGVPLDVRASWFSLEQKKKQF